VLAAVRLVTALPEQAHHLDRLLEHLAPLVGGRSLGPEHVLNQRGRKTRRVAVSELP
jgi:hypothetical protein